ncbi:DUF255 domain-containing protein [Pontibacter sp. G13]|uniref:thioredoxin family protein n=1 Tax=Pontibacter sp. G13 TaxID=3074898 RepID=UPI002888FC94|nr:DUF255 domain-containing protein [Pontibacter sp. G13]WNJ16133.1 DUF255 domain-containing protein [Pontibacter sp. G13]
MIARIFLLNLMFILALGTSHNLQAAGIEFFHGTWQEALDKAKAERKLIFMDAFTTWCGPCKAMARNTFTDAKVGDMFNKEFINVKMDMERGEGPDIARQYQVSAYPTFLFINHRGEIVHKGLGYMPPAKFMDEARKALDPKKNQTLLELEFEEGSEDPYVLYNYAVNLHAQNKDYREAADTYFATQSEKALLSERNWKAMVDMVDDPQSREFQYLLDKRKKFCKAHGELEVNAKIVSVLEQSVLLAAKSGQKSLYQDALKITKTYIDDGNFTDHYLKMTYAEATGDWGDYAYKTVLFFEEHQVTNPKMLNHAAKNFVIHVDDQEQLEKAVQWARQSIALKNEPWNNETYARLLLKLEDHQGAMRTANKARSLAEMKGESTIRLDLLIDQIRDAMNDW